MWIVSSEKWRSSFITAHMWLHGNRYSPVLPHEQFMKTFFVNVTFLTRQNLGISSIVDNSSKTVEWQTSQLLSSHLMTIYSNLLSKFLQNISRAYFVRMFLKFDLDQQTSRLIRCDCIEFEYPFSFNSMLYHWHGRSINRFSRRNYFVISFCARKARFNY